MKISGALTRCSQTMPHTDPEPSFSHDPVLLDEVMEWLKPEQGGVFVDCTLGLGGHTEAMLAASPETRVIGIDQDGEALHLARQRLAPFGSRVTFAQANFKDLAAVLKEALKEANVSDGQGGGQSGVRGILADLGVSSLQFDSGERGFSFSVDAPLDMRMDQSRAE